ncbi:MAG TPA: serine/threonine-protein kinase, partial [Blastocatellia bacterium]|nr:serine/threonine-protein kinase [Blastocatellia bacterium]
MTSDRRHKIHELLARALEHDPDDRDAFLAGETRGDDALRAEIDALIAERERDLPPRDPVPDSLVGRIIADRYRVDARIGEGGMGTVYRATQLNLKRTVALKVIRAQYLGNETAVGRFEREAHAIASLKHPNIITIYDFGMSPDIGMYIVMEYLAGRSLGRELAELKRLRPQQAIRLARQITSALEAAHNAGVVHRDLKPENIFLETTAAGPLGKSLH